MIRTCAFAVFALTILVFNVGADFVQTPSPAYKTVIQIANAPDLSREEKIVKLKELTGFEKIRMIALIQLDRFDAKEAMQTALEIFRAKGSSRESKLRMGHFLLEGNRSRKEGFPKSFTEEFAHYLIDAILTDGEKEFCQKLDGISLTAVGEYAYLASDFQGYKNVDFTPFKDARVVPVLIRCLDAPDNVYSKDQGDCIRGKPGESTGRNVARQQIPVALAKLDDERAVEPLKIVLFKHTDAYGRMNSAYALAILLKRKEDRAAIGKELLAKPELRWCRFHFGKGLIETGDDAGVEFLAIKHAGEYGRLEVPLRDLLRAQPAAERFEGLQEPEG